MNNAGITKNHLTRALYVIAAVVCSGMFVFLFSCGGSSGGSSSDTPDNLADNTSGDTGSRPSLGEYNAMGLVTDISGQPINFAAISNPGNDTTGATKQLTSSGGAFYGDMGAATDGWVHVSADGFAETYANSLGTVNEVSIFKTRLTPLGASTEYKPEIAETLSHGNISVQLPAGLFASETSVEATDISPQNMDASYALMDDDKFHPFFRTFSITARDADGVQVSFASGQNLPVTITLPEAAITVPTLAYFDGAAGKWQEVPDICILDDSTHITCNLPHLSVWGAAGEPSSTPGEASMPYPNPQNTAEVKANIRYWLAVTAQGLKTGDDDLANTGRLMTEEQRVKYVQLAREFAKNHQRDEEGKFALLDASAVSQHLGGYEDALELNGEAATIAENIGVDLLKEDGCGRIRELMQSAAQIQLLGGSTSLSFDLLDKVAEAIDTCDPWIGTISVTFKLAETLPGLSQYKNQGGGAWTEKHDVRLFVDPSSGGSGNTPVYTLTGDDVVDISMPETVYRDTLPVSGCPDGFNDYTLSSFPESDRIILAVDGTYSPDGLVFDIAGIKTAVLGSADGVDLVWSTLLRTYIGDACTLYEYPLESEYKPGYESLIGDSGIQHIPPITLEEMLNTGYKRSSAQTESIEGYKTIELSIPEITIPWAAVQSARVTWQFTHIKQPQESK